MPEERAEIAVEPRVQNGSAVAPVPVDQPIIRTFEHPDAPAWIVDLADRIAGDYASLEEIDVYRRWCRGEEFDAPVAHETERTEPQLLGEIAPGNSHCAPTDPGNSHCAPTLPGTV